VYERKHQYLMPKSESRLWQQSGQDEALLLLSGINSLGRQSGISELMATSAFLYRSVFRFGPYTLCVCCVRGRLSVRLTTCTSPGFFPRRSITF
jgi:hypothetical protein